MKVKILFIIIAFIILGASFYWYSWRPEKIRKDCSTLSTKLNAEWSASHLGSTMEDFNKNFDAFYIRCLEKNGLQK